MAIALGSGFPDHSHSGTLPGQPIFSVFSRRTGISAPPSPRAGENPAAEISVTAAEQPSLLAIQQESAAAAQSAIENSAAEIPGRQVRLVKESFAAIEDCGQQAMEYFYARLFVQNPELRSMFPLAMSAHRQRVFDALATMVASMGSPGELADQVGQLARDHRKFGVKDQHCEAFFSALLATIRQFSAGTWDAGTAAAWEAALGCVSTGMRTAAAKAAETSPAWWVGEVVQHDRRGIDLAVLTIRPDQPLPYLPGQYVSVQVARWPRIWRSFSIANAPRASGLIDLHVRAVPGGMVSTALVQSAQAGDSLLLGPAEGTMTISSGSPGRDLLCIAGGTGLAPVKALIEGVITAGGYGPQRRITLFAGARSGDDLYDLADLARLEASYPLLTVIPAVSQDPSWEGLAGPLPDVVRQYASAEDPGILGREIFVSGPRRMVREVLRILARRVPGERVHYDPQGPQAI
jgi:NAD(P)H-flavin reductase/hemoglobin-like flavoprotein